MDSGFSRRCVVDTNTVRQPEPFGTDHGVMHEMIVTGRSVGADREFYSKLAHDSALFRQVVNFVNGNLSEDGTTTPEIAAEIMGRGFHGTDALERHLDVKLSPTSKKLFLTVPYTPEVLQACRETHVLVACGALSLMDVWRVQTLLFYAKSDPWYGDLSEWFAHSKVKAGWQLVRKNPVWDSTIKTWDEQNKLLWQDEQVPSASVLVQAILIHYLETKERLFEDICVRCSDVDSDGRRVNLGFLDERGLDVGYGWDGGQRSDVGLSSSRKFS
jgi:hypothetical protein